MCCPRWYVCLCMFRSSWRPFALDRVVGPDIGQAGMFEEVEHVVASVVDEISVATGIRRGFRYDLRLDGDEQNAAA